VFNRIAYSVYLTQFPIFFYNIGTTRAAGSYSPHLLVSKYKLRQNSSPGTVIMRFLMVCN